MFNHRFWAYYFREDFVPQLRAVAEVIEKRMLPGFANIDEEARKVSDEAWAAVMSSPGTGDEDPADYAEAAEQAGVSHYMLMVGLRQGMVNLFAAALYHAFEQQIVLLLRREVLDFHEKNNPKLFSVSEFAKRLRAAGINVSQFPSWTVVDELRLLANTVKHGGGKSASKLHKRRPELFENPVLDLGPAFRGRVPPRVFQPLLGDDLYVTLRDVQHYRDALIAFWTELSEALEKTTADAI